MLFDVASGLLRTILGQSSATPCIQVTTANLLFSFSFFCFFFFFLFFFFFFFWFFFFFFLNSSLIFFLFVVSIVELKDKKINKHENESLKLSLKISINH